MHLHIQFVFGAKNRLPTDRDALDFQLAKMRTLLLRQSLGRRGSSGALNSGL